MTEFWYGYVVGAVIYMVISTVVNVIRRIRE